MNRYLILALGLIVGIVIGIILDVRAFPEPQ
jgi:uncharacterized membrane-anchored protein YhcB (DUF1043 family)